MRNGYEWSDADTLAVLQKVLSTDTSTCIYRLLQQDVDLLYFVGYVVLRYTHTNPPLPRVRKFTATPGVAVILSTYVTCLPQGLFNFFAAGLH